MPADRVIAVPELLGRRIAGIPGGWSGFVPVDRLGRVEGMRGVYAAGDVTTFPLKHGGLATQQADTLAHAIAASLGIHAEPPSAERVLRLRLVGGADPLSCGSSSTTTVDRARPCSATSPRRPNRGPPRCTAAT